MRCQHSKLGAQTLHVSVIVRGPCPVRAQSTPDAAFARGACGAPADLGAIAAFGTGSHGAVEVNALVCG